MIRRCSPGSRIWQGIFLCVLLAPSAPVSSTDIPPVGNLPVEDVYQKGVNLFISEKYDEAENIFRYLVKEDPQNAEYTCWLAQSLAFTLGERAMRGASKMTLLPDGKTVRDLYLRAISLDPSSERARIGYAVILRDIPGIFGGDVNKAESILLSVIKDNPKSLSALHHLGTLYIRKKGEWERGLEYLKKAVGIGERGSLSAEDRLQLAKTYHAIGKTYDENLKQPAAAIPYYEKSMQIQSDSVVTLLDLANAYRLDNQTAQAKEMVRKAAELIETRQYNKYRNDLTKIARQLDMKKELNL
ncbi:MAG TPA: tetratricopeptide repeat protein [bacterium]|nr:tetratricopeptide repeat protein [bacterium]HOL96119.1 tetratricopeptide repeat protein [bacterium]HPP02708.1 tetratricopeptide repeat protein [bacterium]